jgi:hypothetical protein
MASSEKSEELKLLSEIARWTREMALPVVRPRVELLLDTDAKKRVYEAIAEGTAPIAAVEKSTGANHADIRKWLQLWTLEGIVEPDSKFPRAQFTLRELGIPAAAQRASRARKKAK